MIVLILFDNQYCIYNCYQIYFQVIFICWRYFPRLNIQKTNMIAQSTKKSFQVDTLTHQISISYQPSHIHFTIVDNETKKLKEGLYYDSTLPESVKQECEAVGDLYDYLQGKSQGQILVDDEFLKFKVVRIKKQRWYNLEIEDCIDSRPGHDARLTDDRKQQAKLQILIQKDQLLQENKQLKKQIQILRMANKMLEKQLMQKTKRQTGDTDENISRKMRKTIHVMHPQTRSKTIIQNQTNALEVNQITITPNKFSRGYSKYFINQNLVIKTCDDPAILIFNEIVNKKERTSFKMMIESQLMHNWIIFGLTSLENANRTSCYFFADSIAFSGSMGLIFVEYEIIDLGVVPQKGDEIEVVVNGSNRTIQWILNKSLLCLHKLSITMNEKDLHPYLMLAKQNDSVRVN